MTGPPAWPPAPPSWPPGPPPRAPRPADVDTGFWLWLVAVPVMTAGYLVNTLTSTKVAHTGVLYLSVGLFALVICTLVVTLLVLMRAGYRWARTVLTGGGLVAVLNGVLGILSNDQRPAVAVTAAVTGIVGSVLIFGGAFLLHRNDAERYFTR